MQGHEATGRVLRRVQKSRSAAGFGDRFARQGRLDRPQRAEGIERFDQPAVGLGLTGEEDVDLAVEEEQDGTVGEVTHSDPLFDGEAGGDAAHVADLEIEQHERGVHLFDGGHDVDPGPHAVDQMSTAERRLDVVDQPVGIGGEKDVRHSAESYTPGGSAPMSGRAACGVSAEGVTMRPVLEINAIRSADGVQVDLAPSGELDAYSVAQFREAFAELADEKRVVVNLSGVQFMDSAGLGALIGGIRRIRESEGRVVIFSDREAITKLLHTTGFDRIVPVKDQYDEAVGALDEDPDS